MSEPNYERMQTQMDKTYGELAKLPAEERCRLIACLVVMFRLGEEITNRLGYNGPIRCTTQVDPPA